MGVDAETVEALTRVRSSQALLSCSIRMVAPGDSGGADGVALPFAGYIDGGNDGGNDGGADEVAATIMPTVAPTELAATNATVATKTYGWSSGRTYFKGPTFLGVHLLIPDCR